MNRRKRDAYDLLEPPNNGHTQSAYLTGMQPLRVRRRPYGVWVRVITIALPILLVLGVAGLVAGVIATNRSANELVARTEGTYNPGYRVRFAELGAQVAAGWFNGQQPIVSYASSVKWEQQVNAVTAVQVDPNTPPLTDVVFLRGYQTPLRATAAEEGGVAFVNPVQEVLTYSALLLGQPVEVNVSLGIPDIDDEQAPPVLMSPPTLTQPEVVGAVSVSDEPSGDNLEAVSRLGDTVAAQLTAWAQAWASNDAQGLKQLTGDTSTRVYEGLGEGWSLAQSSSGSGATLVDSSWQYLKEIDGTTYLVTRVTFPIVLSLEDGRQSQNIQTMDLLVAEYSTGLPEVVAWGPSGSWEQLVPYQNGVEPQRGGSSTSTRDQTTSTPSTAPAATPSAEDPAAGTEGPR